MKSFRSFKSSNSRCQPLRSPKSVRNETELAEIQNNEDEDNLSGIDNQSGSEYEYGNFTVTNPLFHKFIIKNISFFPQRI